MGTQEGEIACGEGRGKKRDNLGRKSSRKDQVLTVKLEACGTEAER